ncbi:ATPase [Leptospira selangorensis]|uniref:ATPase n=1 Tax=Leptospira selangorensis TaxID=2484982 RepID=A0A5F2C5M1_9LEPT|nr:SRPBCC family protein [Leptospira selangorensis]TGM14012.1 ATPase [Leptospira selangorensis]TGM27056.1 ATPase [Leptospira selangorensis]
MKAEVSVVGKEIIGIKTFDAPRELVWDAWTDPKHVAIWWGPNGFTNTIHEMSVKPGGIWRFIMHGPDGVDYPNRIEFIEVVKPEKLVYDHGDDSNPKQFHVTVVFEEEGSKTKLTMRSRFPSEDDIKKVADFALDGLRETLGRLENFLGKK